MSRIVTSCILSISLIVISGCSAPSDDSSLRPRTLAEEEAITNSWYPIANQECQLLVDSLNLIGAAIGSTDLQHLSDNMEEIKRNLEQVGKIASVRVLELSLATTEPSIRDYAIEAVPVFASLGSVLAEDSEDFTAQMNYLTKLRKLTDRVPDACKS
jgi:hypothetical protein